MLNAWMVHLLTCVFTVHSLIDQRAHTNNIFLTGGLCHFLLQLDDDVFVMPTLQDTTTLNDTHTTSGTEVEGGPHGGRDNGRNINMQEQINDDEQFIMPW